MDHRQVARIGARMYDSDDVELALYALGEGMGLAEAAELVGASRETVRRWRLGLRPHGRGAGPGRQRAAAAAGRRREAMGLYDPPAAGPLSGLTPDQVENVLLRAVLADLKAAGWDPASISNRSKRELGERLRRATGLPLRSVIGFLRMSKSSYEYRRARLGRPGRRAELGPAVERAFREEGRCARGYRFVTEALRRLDEPVVVSEKVVRGVMRERGLRVACARRPKRYGSYAGGTDEAPGNLPLNEDGTRDFRAGAPDEKRVSDITEFRLPGDPRKVYLSAAIDLFDGKPAGWSVGTSPDAELASSSLEAACARLGPGEAPMAHADRGCHYRRPGWKRVCAEHGLTRSMSRKGRSPDNAACEGFFGRLKNEFFYGRDWRGVTAGELMRRLDAWMRFYSRGRLKAFREGGRTAYDTIDGRRERLGLAV